MRTSLLIVVAALLASPVARAAPPAAGPSIGRFGFDQTGMDRDVKPGDNFFAFANGAWLKRTPIPEDRSSTGGFGILDDLSLERSRTILDEVRNDEHSQIGALYASFMDEAGVQRAGLAPLQRTLDALHAIRTPSDFARQLGMLVRTGLFSGPFGPSVYQDDKAPDRYAASLWQGGLGLPDRDYYSAAEPEYVETRDAYVAYLGTLLGLAGETDAATRARAVMAFETALAAAHLDRADTRDTVKSFNPWPLVEYAARAPGFDWLGYWQALALDTQAVVIARQPGMVTAAAHLIAQTPIDTLRDYLIVHALNGAAPDLDAGFVDAEFAFNRGVLAGTPKNRPRWELGTRLVQALLGHALARPYVDRYFTSQTKDAATKLTRVIVATMDARLATLTWMTPATRAAAHAKIASMVVRIGYPDRWRDYSGLEIRHDDLLGNVMRAQAFNWQRQVDLLGRPVDHTDWGDMTPMVVNAEYDWSLNSITFTAAILQPPFFDANADDAVNYGGIGMIIGHEISHGFDDQGRHYDSTGAMRDWWTARDARRFETRADALVKQYDRYEPLPGLHVRGSVTLGENIADLAGATIAFDAYIASLQGRPAPVLDGFTGPQRFFLGMAQAWRSRYRDPAMRAQVVGNEHAPPEQRVDTVRNLDAWYRAFDVKPGDRLYLAPAERVRIW